MILMKNPAKSTLCKKFLSLFVAMGFFIFSCLWWFLFSLFLFFLPAAPLPGNTTYLLFISTCVIFAGVHFHSQGFYDPFHLDRINRTPPAWIFFSSWIPNCPTTSRGASSHHIQSTVWVSGNKNSARHELKPQSLLYLYLFLLESQGTPSESLSSKSLLQESQCCAISPSISNQSLTHIPANSQMTLS